MAPQYAKNVLEQGMMYSCCRYKVDSYSTRGFHFPSDMTNNHAYSTRLAPAVMHAFQARAVVVPFCSPIATPKLISMRFLTAKIRALACSAALPTSGTTIVVKKGMGTRSCLLAPEMG